MTEKEKMLSGMLYCAEDKELKKDFMKCRELVRMYNQTTEGESERRREILEELLGGIGRGGHIEGPFHCDYGQHIFVGDNFYANFNLVILDVCEVHIGDNVMFGPGVSIYTAGHPVDAGVRIAGLEFGKPIAIGDNVWIGGSTVVNPGVSIGANTVIGSGSVVTKPIPENVIAAGNPCRVLRGITEEDKEFWEEQRRLYWESKQD